MENIKRKNLNKVKNNSIHGITLIALVITIVVLIILAGIVINLTLSQNGIFNKAKVARDDYQRAQLNEQVALNEVAQYIEEIGTISVENLKEGDYIKYNTGDEDIGENGIITCRVLYDATSEYGIQIISAKSVADVEFGGSDWNTASAFYNNAIVRLNKEAEKYLNKAYAVDARCVGSVPTNQNGKFINKNSENVGPVTLQFTSSAEGANNMKAEDTNYETDKNQLEKLAILEIEEEYWLASRFVYFDEVENENEDEGSYYIFRNE